MTDKRYVRTDEAAHLLGMSPATFRKWASRRVDGGWMVYAPEGLWPDKRSPLWDVDVIVEARGAQRGSSQDD